MGSVGRPIHKDPTPQLTGPKESIVKVLEPDTPGPGLLFLYATSQRGVWYVLKNVDKELLLFPKP